MSASSWLVCTDLRLLAKVLVEANNWSAETIRLPTSGSAAARLFPRRIVGDIWTGSPRPEPHRTAPHRSGSRLQSSTKKVVWRGRPVAQAARPTKVLGSGWIASCCLPLLGRFGVARNFRFVSATWPLPRTWWKRLQPQQDFTANFVSCRSRGTQSYSRTYAMVRPTPAWRVVTWARSTRFSAGGGAVIHSWILCHS